MPKYFEYKICGYYLYFTSKCVLEAMHAHASDRKFTESGSAKFFVKNDGSSVIVKRGQLTDRELMKIQSFIKENYITMFEKWAEFSDNGYFEGN